MKMNINQDRLKFRLLLPAFGVSVILILALMLSACDEKKVEASVSQPPPEVNVALPIKKIVTEWDEFTGRFEAIERVDVRARVTGYLIEERFKDGQIVEKGEILWMAGFVNGVDRTYPNRVCHASPKN
ncbi:MAG: efflux RND transporter periplasmic adaptor subunit [Desulfobacterales bacterium]|jgi:multidrug efflux pump subunit AcrA (membrane-fusion protein)